MSGEPTLRVVPGLAVKLGLDESIMLLQIDFWISISSAPHHDGRRWTYQTTRDMQKKALAFWSVAKVNRLVHELHTAKLIIVANHNRRTFDRTLWFALTARAIRILRGFGVCLSQNETSISQNETPMSQDETSISQNGEMHFSPVQNAFLTGETTIPENTSEIPTENTSENTTQREELEPPDWSAGEDAADAPPYPNGHHPDPSTQQPEQDPPMDLETGELPRKPWAEMKLGERHNAMFDALAVCMSWNPKHNPRQATFLGKASLEIRQMDERYSDEFILWAFGPEEGWWYRELYAWKTRKQPPEVIKAPTLKEIADTAGQAWTAYQKSPEMARAGCHCDHLDPDLGHIWQDHLPSCPIYQQGAARHERQSFKHTRHASVRS